MIWPFTRKPRVPESLKPKPAVQPDAHPTTDSQAVARIWAERRRQRNLDARRTPVNNPLDYRADGSIRPGDPMWAILMGSMDDGQPRHGTQNADGTWDVQKATPENTWVPDPAPSHDSSSSSSSYDSGSSDSGSSGGSD